MKEVIKIFEQIKNTSGLNDKKAILSQNKDNELFKKCLVWLLDGNKISGISVKKINKKVYETDYFMPSIEDVLNYFEHHNTGTDDDIARVQSFIRHQPEECHDFYIDFVTKSYKIGCDAKVVNSVIPGLIPTFDIQLGTSIEKCKLSDNCYISISHKMNGTRCCLINGEFKSRQNKTYLGLNHIYEDIKKLGIEEWFVDGELVYKNDENLSDSEAFQIGCGLVAQKDADKSQLKLIIFDTFPSDEFINCHTSVKTYRERKNDLLCIKKKIEDENLQNIEVVEFMYEGTDHSKIWECLNKAEELGWEGIMINLDTQYECKRTKNLIKVKKFFDIDLRCIGVNIATSGKYKGLMGSITCKYFNNTVDVGSGFSDYERKYYAEHPEEIVGKIITVKYKEITKDKNTHLESLQFPVKINIDRFDKAFADDEF